MNSSNLDAEFWENRYRKPGNRLGWERFHH